MELRSIDGESYISLTDWEVDDLGMKAAIAVRDRDFSGAHDEVWFAYDAFEAFIHALGQFSVAHEGEARLESMEVVAPDTLGDVVLSIQRLDMARHVVAEAQVCRRYYRRGHYFADKVAVSFELDPAQLPDAVRRLADVIAETESS